MRKTLTAIRNLLIRIVVLVLVFIGSVIVFSKMINRVTPDVAEVMSNTTFPLIYMKRDGVSFNCLHGYSREMDVSYMRDSITPLSSNRELDLQIQTFGTTVDSISYEVLSLDGTESLENTKIIKVTKDDDYLTASLTMQNKMLMNQEYILKITVKAGGRNIYYYTHVLLADGLHAVEYLNYVSGFYDKCVNKTDLNTVGAAVEPDATTDEDATLAAMDIHDSVDQLTWADLNPQIYYKPTPRLTEINQNTATLTMDYRIASVNDVGLMEVFNVHEYYRVRYTDSRVFLLNFYRTTGEVFNPENNVLEDLGINLGISGKHVEYESDERNRVVAFVQEDELWTYELMNGKLTQVFSFPQKEDMDYRDFYNKNVIRILRVDSQGNVWFEVAGYMNRGSHEGENGVAVYYYDSATAMVDERMFLASMENAELLAEDVTGLSYISEDGSRYYVLLEETVYEVSIQAGTYREVVTDVAHNCYAASDSGRIFCWLDEGLEYDSTTIRIIDLETGTTRETACAATERIRPVAFMGEDLVYGIAYLSDISVEHGGNGLFPMYRLMIEDSEGNIIKNYEPDGYYVTGTEQSDHMLTLRRVVLTSAGFREAQEDHIVNTDTEDAVSLGAATKTSARKQTEIVLRLGTTISTRNPQVVRSKIITSETSRTIEIPVNRDRQKLFYVYAYGTLDRICTYANEAIVRADEMVGVVMDYEQNYVWVRGDRSTRAEIEMNRVPEIMRSGTLDLDDLSAGIGKQAVDLSGCTLDQMLYLVSHGKPVIAMTGKGPVTIVGYDEFNVYLVDPEGDEWYYSGMNDSTQMFEEAGNVFISYLDVPV